MELAHALDLLRSTTRGVLVTRRGDGRPQLSNILYSVGDDGQISISTTADRAKARNLQRDPAASLYVSPEGNFWAYVVVDGEAELSPVAAAVDDPVVDELVELYRRLVGEHKDWDDYRKSMVTDRRLVVRVRPTHAYGMWPES
jgi:PPOX class probable F420-dependent enzyme